MANATHTPGPWHTFSNSLGVGVTAYYDVAHCSGFDTNRSKSEEEANARLIAAAPDLLAALEAADNRLNQVQPGHGPRANEMVNELRPVIRAAIRLAKHGSSQVEAA